jgi:hypothetical protein
MRASLFFTLPFALVAACSSSSDDAPPADTATPTDSAPSDTKSAEDTTPGVDTLPPGTPCEASLSAACSGKECPNDIDKAPTAGMCAAAASGVRRSTTACANWQIIQYTDASGVVQNIYYNSSTGSLAGWTKGTGASETCVAGMKGFRFPNYDDCAWVFGPDLCKTLDAGVDASPDTSPTDSASPDATDGG